MTLALWPVALNRLVGLTSDNGEDAEPIDPFALDIVIVSPVTEKPAPLLPLPSDCNEPAASTTTVPP